MANTWKKYGAVRISEADIKPKGPIYDLLEGWLDALCRRKKPTPTLARRKSR